jgi:ATP-dependent protease ClpP protease subunit
MIRFTVLALAACLKSAPESAPEVNVAETHTFDLAGGIDEDAVKHVTEHLEKAKAEGAKQVLMRVNSPGGNLDEALLIAQLIERSEIPVDCLVDGDALSAAFYILQSCRDRAATARSALMAHEPYFRNLAHADRQTVTEALEMIDVVAEQFIQHCAARLKISLGAFRRRIKGRDWWMTPAQALEAGAIDRVVPPPNAPKK